MTEDEQENQANFAMTSDLLDALLGSGVDALAPLGALLGTDLCGVQIERGDRASAARTDGRDVLTLDSTDPETVIHEAVHVAQRRLHGEGASTPFSHEGDAAEREARAAVPALLAGHPWQVRQAPSAMTQFEETPDPATLIHKAFHDGIFTEDEDAALAALRQGGGGTRAVYLERYGRKLELEFRSYCSEEQYIAAMSILWPAMDVIDRIETNLGWNDNEAGIVQVIQTASDAELAAVADRIGPYLATLDADQRYDARMRIWPDARVEHVGARIREADGYVWDDESEATAALLDLTPEERLQVWQRYQDELKDLLSASALEVVRRMCVGQNGGPATEADALSGNMELATSGLTDDEDAVSDTLNRTGAMVKEKAELEAMLSAGTGSDGQPLTEEQRARIEARLAELAGITDLLNGKVDADGTYQDGSFLGSAQEAIDADSFEQGQTAAGVDVYQIAKQRLLEVPGLINDDEATLWRVLEGIVVPITFGPDEHPEQMSPDEIARRQKEAKLALFKDLRADKDLAHVWACLDGDEVARLDAILTGDTYKAAAFAIRELLSAINVDQAALLKRIAAMNEADRDKLLEDTDLVNAVKAVGDEDWRSAVSETINSGQIPTWIALDYALGGTHDGTDEDTAFDALGALSEEDRAVLRRGYLLAHRATNELSDADQAALDKYKELYDRLADEMGPEDLDTALVNLVGLPSVDSIQTDQGRLEAAEILLYRQQERMELRGSLTDAVSKTDNTMEQAHIQFVAVYQDALGDGAIDLAEFAALVALDQEFNACFDQYKAASNAISDIAGTIAAVAVGIAVIAASGGTATPGVAAALKALGGARGVAALVAVGGSAKAIVGEAFGGSFTDVGDATRGFASGSVEVFATLLGASLANMATKWIGLSGQALKLQMVRAAAGGTEVGLGSITRRAAVTGIEAAFDGAIGGALGELVFTLTDANTWKQSIWGMLAAAGQAVIRGGLLGGTTGAVVGGSLDMVSSLVRSRGLTQVAVELDESMGRGARVVATQGDGGGISGYKLIFGPEVTDTDLLAHLDTLEQLQRLGTLRSRIANLIKGETELPGNSVGAAARLELEKLDTLIADRSTALSGGALSPESRLVLKGEIDVMQSHLEALAAKVDDASALAGDIEIKRLDAPPGYPDPPEGHYYYRKPDGEWDIRRFEANDEIAPQTLVSDGEGGWSFSARAGSETRSYFDASISGEAVIEQLTSPSSASSFRPYAEMLKTNGLATHDELVASADAILNRLRGTAGAAGLSEDTLRHELKSAFKQRVLDRMFELDGVALTETESIAARATLLKGLNPSDSGNLSEAWYLRYQSTFKNNPDLDVHPKLPADGELNTIDRKPDLLDGDVLVEIKSGSSSLAERDIEQITDYLDAVSVSDGASVTVDGMQKQATSVRLVFLDPQGARASMNQIEKLWNTQGGSRLTVEVFVNGSAQRTESLAELVKLLGTSP